VKGKGRVAGIHSGGAWAKGSEGEGEAWGRTWLEADGAG